ncbi:MAG: hypothetical protein KDJ38_10120 [Gammaproteobacteria bacterium]|nr:hypothetical protein [Gammaproteobacteria bacterium]
MTTTHAHRKQQSRQAKNPSIMNLDEMPELIARVLLNDRRSANSRNTKASKYKYNRLAS